MRLVSSLLLIIIILSSFQLRHYTQDHTLNDLISAEYSFRNTASIRFGYLHNYDEQNLTFGAGVIIGPKIDYAHTPFGIFDSVNRISIGLSR